MIESPAELRRALETIGAIDRRDLKFESVCGTQIISALLKEIGMRFAKGFVYHMLQSVANEARHRSLLINPNAHETYSTAVGNTARMRPSASGWERTKGILSRHIVEAEGFLRLKINNPSSRATFGRNFGW